MERKTFIRAFMLSALLFSALIGVFRVKSTHSNPIMNVYRDASPPEGAQPPIITIHTPTNGSSCPNNVILTFDVAVPRMTGDEALDAITKIYYKTNWEREEILVAEKRSGSFSIDLSYVQGGSLSVTIYAVGVGYIQTGKEVREEDDVVWSYNYYDQFEMTGYSTVIFVKDLIPPKITVSQPQNRTYCTSNVELEFTVIEDASEILYCLDGNDNQTITGNVTLTGLENGAHSITFYASDLVGNAAIPKTVYFAVDSPAFPTMNLVAVMAVMVSCGLGVLVYFKKRASQDFLTKKQVR